MQQAIQLEHSWKIRLQAEFEKPYMQNLKVFLQEQKQQGKVIYPPGKQIFAALNSVPFDKVKVVILGQDPYHGPGQAHGLCFSVPDGVSLPPSLKNIFKELQNDLGIKPKVNGNLTAWAEQGVLLLNSVLTVEAGQAGSHQGKGWEQFTDNIISLLNEEKQQLVFLLWGSYAHKKGAVIDEKKHYVLKTVHPSPLSVHRGFLGCRHFSQTNRYLRDQGFSEINW
jgi:uracil-DNA glycosylase